MNRELTVGVRERPDGEFGVSAPRIVGGSNSNAVPRLGFEIVKGHGALVRAEVSRHDYPLVVVATRRPWTIFNREMGYGTASIIP